MNDTPQAAPAPTASGEADKPAPAEDGPSTTAASPQSGKASLLSRISGLFRRNGSSLREDLADALAGAELDGATFSPGERAMLNNILRLREVRVEDVMIPRADVEAIELSTTLGDLLAGLSPAEAAAVWGGTARRVYRLEEGHV